MAEWTLEDAVHNAICEYEGWASPAEERLVLEVLNILRERNRDTLMEWLEGDGWASFGN